MEPIPWISAGVAALVAVALAGWLVIAQRRRSAGALPTEWALTPRPVFSVDERRVYRLLREALPHHIVLSKLPLVRFCQPTDPSAVRYWFDLLGGAHVTFAVCSPNGRVLAALDLDAEKNAARRSLQIKQAVLTACRVRYLRCPADNLPSVAELQLLVPSSASAGARSPQPASAPAPDPLSDVRDTLSSTVATRRAERSALWQDSSLFQDSFFAPDSRLEAFGNSDFMPPGDGVAHAPRRGRSVGWREITASDDAGASTIPDALRSPESDAGDDAPEREPEPPRRH
ncbi:DUF2726 domain-containing protein [Piscinibacter koreensis]|uniref:DUF2726 domain-containing protein n=1 Tax=Piscinibacter koreensis TaxID=2742824 RepID=A0A7Y6TW06_9BURK|nr:DUF2726 domain-containing protein [Schlegelella koreensis]NUZ05585.1 DUF2726 domain-containing protein [Schlegelella koreensis]